MTRSCTAISESRSAVEETSRAIAFARGNSAINTCAVDNVLQASKLNDQSDQVSRGKTPREEVLADSDIISLIAEQIFNARRSDHAAPQDENSNARHLVTK